MINCVSISKYYTFLHFSEPTNKVVVDDKKMINMSLKLVKFVTYYK